MKESVKELDPNARVILFGSFARGNPRPDSDVDVLVISDAYGVDLGKAVEMLFHINERVGVFEIHVDTTEQYEKWYRRLIDAYREI